MNLSDWLIHQEISSTAMRLEDSSKDLKTLLGWDLLCRVMVGSVLSDMPQELTRGKALGDRPALTRLATRHPRSMKALNKIQWCYNNCCVVGDSPYVES